MARENKGRLYLLMLALLGFLLLTGWAWMEKTVTLQVGGMEREIKTCALTVGQLLQLEEVTLDSRRFQVTPGWNYFLRDGTTVIVNKGVPVTLNIDGEKKEVIAYSERVRGVLEEHNINAGRDDEIKPGPGEKINPGMELKIIHQQVETMEKEVAIPYKTVLKKNPGVSRGETRVIQEGHAGSKKEVWEVTYRGGKEYKRELKSSTVTAEPVNRIVQVSGTSETSRGTREYGRKLEMVATAYTHTGYKTSTGVPARHGVVAVDPRVIPLGTELYVENYGYCVAMDQGGSVKGNRIDLFMETREKALRWGKRRVNVYVLR